MADTLEWRYSKGGQQSDPLSSADLKELAASGELAPGDLVWKTEWTEWRRADSVKGLFPQETAVNGPPDIPPRSHPESFRIATDAAMQVSQRLWFLDLKFEQFATPRLIGVVFAAAIIVMAFFACGLAIYVLLNFPALQAIFILLFDFALLVLFAIGFRVFLECCLVGFRIAEHLSYLKYLQKGED